MDSKDNIIKVEQICKLVCINNHKSNSALLTN